MLNAHWVVEANANNWHTNTLICMIMWLFILIMTALTTIGWVMNGQIGYFRYKQPLISLSLNGWYGHDARKCLHQSFEHFALPNIRNQVCWTFDYILVSFPQMPFCLIAFACTVHSAIHFSESIFHRFQVSVMRWTLTTGRSSQFV